MIFISRVKCDGSYFDNLTVFDLERLHHSRVHRVQVDGEGQVGAGVYLDLGDLEAVEVILLSVVTGAVTSDQVLQLNINPGNCKNFLAACDVQILDISRDQLY